MGLHHVLLISLLLLPSARIVTGSGTDGNTFSDATELPDAGAVLYSNATLLSECVPQVVSAKVMNTFSQANPIRDDASGGSKQTDIERANQIVSSVAATLKNPAPAALRATRSVTTSIYRRRVNAGRRCSGRLSRQAVGVKLSRSVRISIKSNQIVVPRNRREFAGIGAGKIVDRHADKAWETMWFSFVATATRMIKNMFAHEDNARKFRAAIRSSSHRSTRRLTFRKSPETGNTADVKVLETGHTAPITSAKDERCRKPILLKASSVSHNHMPPATNDTSVEAGDAIAPMSEGRIQNAPLLLDGKSINMSSFDDESSVRDCCIVDIKMMADRIANRNAPDLFYGKI